MPSVITPAASTNPVEMKQLATSTFKGIWNWFSQVFETIVAIVSNVMASILNTVLVKELYERILVVDGFSKSSLQFTPSLTGSSA